jgi:PAS domain S-box-containing protein
MFHCIRHRISFHLLVFPGSYHLAFDPKKPDAMEPIDTNSHKFRYSMIRMFLKDRVEKLISVPSNTLAQVDSYFLQLVEVIKNYHEIILDKDGTILTWSRIFRDLKGYLDEEVVGQNINLLFLPGDRQSMVPQALLDRAAKEGTATHFGQFVKKDGSTFWGSIKVVVVKKDKAEVLGYTAICRRTDKFPGPPQAIPPSQSAGSPGT